MRDPEAILTCLSKHASNELYKFKNLYRILYNKNIYISALSTITSNNGSDTAGIDQETISDIHEKVIEKLIVSVKDETYQPAPYVRIHIPKKNGSQRPLGIPSIRDRLLQEVCRKILEAIYEPTFIKQSCGFRKNMGCHTALEHIKSTFTSVNWFIEGDICNFYDNINHGILLQMLERRISDQRFIGLIKKFLNAGYVEQWKFFKTYSGTPQGGIISPILANIYLDALDRYIMDYKTKFDVSSAKSTAKLNPKYWRINGQVTYYLDRLKKYPNHKDREVYIKKLEELKKIRKTINSRLPAEETGCKRIEYVRYADDFIVGVAGSYSDSVKIKEDLKTFLECKLKLQLSENKTKITNSYSKARFLGYDITISKESHGVTRKDGSKTRSGFRAVQLLMPHDVIINSIIKFRMVEDINAKQWRMMHRPELTPLSALEIVKIYNSQIRGLYNYYSLAKNVTGQMNQYYYVSEYSCLKTLAAKFKSSLYKIREKFRIGKHWGIRYQSKDKSKIMYFYKDGFKRKRDRFYNANVDIKQNPITFCGRNELEKRLNAHKCELCGNETGKFFIHHIHRMKDVAKGKEQWEKLMIARNRKTMVLCKECHIKVHKNDVR